MVAVFQRLPLRQMSSVDTCTCGLDAHANTNTNTSTQIYIAASTKAVCTVPQQTRAAVLANATRGDSNDIDSSWCGQWLTP